LIFMEKRIRSADLHEAMGLTRQAAYALRRAGILPSVHVERHGQRFSYWYEAGEVIECLSVEAIARRVPAWLRRLIREAGSNGSGKHNLASKDSKNV